MYDFISDPILILNYPESTIIAIMKVSNDIKKIIHKDGAVYIKDYGKYCNISDTDSSDVDAEGIDYDIAPGDRRKDLNLNVQELKEILNKVCDIIIIIPKLYFYKTVNKLYYKCS